MNPVAAGGSTAKPSYTFTAVGFLVLLLVGAVLAANKKTGSLVVWLLALVLLSMVLINYRNFTGALFTKTGG
ncbi:MAG: hypothetical protein ACYCSN_15430 [Acidobacteriaceae bacterium]